MKKEVLSKRQTICLLISVFISELMLGGGHYMEQTGGIVAMALAVGLAIPVAFIILYILSNNPEKDVFDISLDVGGKVIGKALIIMFILYGFLTGFHTLQRAAASAQVQSMTQSPLFITVILMILLAYVFLRKGIENVARTTTIFIPITYVMFVIILVLLVPSVRINNVLPIVAEPWGNVAKGVLTNYAFIFGEILLIMAVIIDSKKKGNQGKAIFLSLAIAGMTYVVLKFFISTVLGVALASKVRYPIFTMVSVITIGDFITRIEILLDAILVVSLFVKFILTVYICIKGIGKLVGAQDHRKFLIPVLLILTFLSTEIAISTHRTVELKDQYYWVLLLFQFGLPIIIGLLVLFRSPKNKKRSQVLKN